MHPSLGALLSAHQSIGVPEPVKVFGTPEQKQEYLPRCAAGAITAFLLTEPDVGSDPARMGSTAVPTDDGDAYILDGVKLWTTNGVIAELVVVMALVPEHTDSDGTVHKGGISAFVVEMDSPGITVENRNAFMGLRGIENGVTRFHQVRVPAANRLGREGQGLKIALTTLNTGRLSIPALCVASGRWSLKIAREWSTPAPSGAGPWASTRPSARKSLSSRQAPSPWTPCSSCPPKWPTPARRTSGSKPPWPNSGPRRSATGSRMNWCRSGAAAVSRRRIRWKHAASGPCRPSSSSATSGSTGSSRAPRRS